MGELAILISVVVIVIYARSLWGPRRRRLFFGLIGRFPARLIAVLSPKTLRHNREAMIEQRLSYLADPWQATPWRFRWLQGAGLVLGVALALSLNLWMSEGRAKVQVNIPGGLPVPSGGANSALHPAPANAPLAVPSGADASSQPPPGPPGAPGNGGPPPPGQPAPGQPPPGQPPPPPEGDTLPASTVFVLGVILSIPLGSLGWALPRQALNGRVEQRKQRLLLQLADLLELMAITMRAGAEFDQALETATASIYERYSRRPDQYPLGVELAQAVFERNMGVSRADFMGSLGLRATMRQERNENELSDAAVTLWDELTQAVTLSQEVGSSLRETLPEIVERVRNGRLKSAEQAAANARVTLIYPQMLLVVALMMMLLGSVGLFIYNLLAGGL